MPCCFLFLLAVSVSCPFFLPISMEFENRLSQTYIVLRTHRVSMKVKIIFRYSTNKSKLLFKGLVIQVISHNLFMEHKRDFDQNILVGSIFDVGNMKVSVPLF